MAKSIPVNWIVVSLISISAFLAPMLLMMANAQSNIFSVTKRPSVIEAGTTKATVNIVLGDAGTVTIDDDTCPSLDSTKAKQTAKVLTAVKGKNALAFTGLEDGDIFYGCELTFDPTTSELKDRVVYLGAFGVGVKANALVTGVGSTAITRFFSALGTFVKNNAEIIITATVFIGIVGYAMARLGIRVR